MQRRVGLGEVQSLLGFGAVAGGTALYPPVQRKAGKVKGGADQGTGVDVERAFEGRGGKSVESFSQNEAGRQAGSGFQADRRRPR